MFQDRCYDRDIDINNNYYAENMVNDVDMNYNANTMNMDSNMNYQMDSCPQPIVEPMQEKCIQKVLPESTHFMKQGLTIFRSQVLCRLFIILIPSRARRFWICAQLPVVRVLRLQAG